MDMHHGMHNGGNSSPHQSLEDMPMPGHFPDTPDIDDFEDLDTRFSRIGLDSSLSRGAQLTESTYEGWTLYRGEPKTPGGERTWATATICKMPLPQAELIDLVHKQKRQSVTEAYNELTLVKRQHIDNLIEQRKQECNDPKYDWICVYINSATRDVRSTFGPKKALTISIAIVLCKQLKPEILRARRAAQIIKEKKARDTARHDKNMGRAEFADPLRGPFHPSGLGLNLSDAQQLPNPQKRPPANSQHNFPLHSQSKPTSLQHQPQPPPYLPQGHPEDHPHPHHGQHGNHGQHSFNPANSHNPMPPQGQSHLTHPPPTNHELRMVGKVPFQGALHPEYGQEGPPEEFGPPRYPRQMMQQEIPHVTPRHHQQDRKILPEMIQIPPPPIGPHQSQPRLLPAPHDAHPDPRYHQLHPGAQGLNEAPMPPRQHHPGNREEPRSTQVYNRALFDPNQHHSGNENAYKDARMVNQEPQSTHPQRSRRRAEEVPNIQMPSQDYQHHSQRYARQEQPPTATHEPKQPRNKQHKKKKLPPKIVNSEKARREQEIVEKWLEEDSEPSDYDSYLFDPENASSVTDDSFSFEEYDNCDYPPDDDTRRPCSNKNRGNQSREKSKSSDRNGHRKHRHSLGYRIHVRPSEKTSYPIELPRPRGSQYPSGSVELQPFSSTHKRPGKLARSETVSYPSRRHRVYPYERGSQKRSPERLYPSELAWELDLREKERAHQRYLESQLSIEREVEARLLAESLARGSPDQAQAAQLEGYTPQRVLDTYEKYDRMKRLDGNRRQSYMEQPHSRDNPKDYLSHERPFRR
ncbi:hypothetical protein TEQG_03372 [Trichophyton equinum CBS 127.97]|uniref:Uncharacterized protein n=1 Tax=Trichophyton equinum (strain ATCC MYA-4606 / CBS 127.97) TaxID=559882 RepID=F2PR26_TRIEC|nr:hypothetical protein TEQG_03372 [Trichophyton equinum CBS 127.97]